MAQRMKVVKRRWPGSNRVETCVYFITEHQPSDVPLGGAELEDNRQLRLVLEGRRDAEKLVLAVVHRLKSLTPNEEDDVQVATITPDDVRRLMRRYLSPTTTDMRSKEANVDSRDRPLTKAYATQLQQVMSALEVLERRFNVCDRSNHELYTYLDALIARRTQIPPVPCCCSAAVTKCTKASSAAVQSVAAESPLGDDGFYGVLELRDVVSNAEHAMRRVGLLLDRLATALAERGGSVSLAGLTPFIGQLDTVLQHIHHVKRHFQSKQSENYPYNCRSPQHGGAVDADCRNVPSSLE